VVGDQAFVADGRKSGGTYDDHGGRWYVKGSVGQGPVAQEHLVAYVLVQHGERGRADDDLVRRLQAMPGQDGRGHRLGRRARHEHGDGLVVDLGVVVVEPAPGGHIGVVVEEPHGRRGDVVARVEGVVPVPAI
jgi:hypothetical protein